MSGILGTISGVLDLIPCTWRLVPIVMTSCSIEVRPQNKVHTGAYWTKPRVEFLGDGPKTIRIEGFLDPSYKLLERPLLEAMITAPGSGLLSVPEHGVFYAACLGGTFNTDVSNIIEVSLEFIETLSPFGATVQSLLSGSLPDSIGSAVADAQDSVATAVTGMF